MSVSSHSLERVVLKMLNHGNIVLNALRSRVFGTIVRTEDFSLDLFPVGPVDDKDIVIHEPTPVLIVVKILEIFLVGRSAGAKEGSHRYIIIVPFGNYAHSSVNLGCTLRVTHHSHLPASISLLDCLDTCWEIVNRVLLPVQGPELRLIDGIKNVLLRVFRA